MSKDFANSYTDFLFDFDNTLVDEKDYLFQAYHYIERVLNIHFESNYPIYAYLVNGFNAGGRSHLFDNCISRFELPAKAKVLMLDCLRTVKLNRHLQLLPQSKKLLLEISSAQKRIFIITNGNPAQQRNKINQTQWPEEIIFTEICFANEFEPKPSIKSFEHLNEIYHFSNPVYIGDAESDALFAKHCGVMFVNIEEI